ncbi:MAG: DUF3322 domain-containing protein [Polaromonas sp.]
MTSKKLLSPKDALAAVRKKYESHHEAWLLQDGDASEGWPLCVALGAPGEKDAIAAPVELRAWIASWRNWEGVAHGVQLVWSSRLWPKLGAQELPARLEVNDPAAAASISGAATRWSRARRRYQDLCGRWPSLTKSKLMARFFNVWAEYSPEDFERLVRMLEWLLANPESGHYLRQLPVEGLDTKWIDNKKALVHDLLQWLQARARDEMPAGDGRDFFALCGLANRPIRIRLRILCPDLRKQVGGMCDLEVPVPELAALALRPEVVLITENLETALALPDLPGTVAFMRLGYSVDLLQQLQWVQQAPLQLYWGDLDTHGFAILNRARRILPRVKAVLMDEATLIAHLNLCGTETTPATGEEFAYLHSAELAVYQGLKKHAWGDSLRLEQERLPWDYCLHTILAEMPE